jgi:hypothetical protein
MNKLFFNSKQSKLVLQCLEVKLPRQTLDIEMWVYCRWTRKEK